MHLSNVPTATWTNRLHRAGLRQLVQGLAGSLRAAPHNDLVPVSITVQQEASTMLRLTVGVLSILAWCGTAAVAEPGPLQVAMKDSRGEDVGTITFSQRSKVVDVTVSLHNIAPGEHGLHVHQGAACTAPTFDSAGGHLNPTGKQHGFANPDGHHAGDFPMSVKADVHGNATATFHSEDLSFDPSSPASLFGKTVVLHESADDQKTDPAGASGKRIACGMIPTLGFL